MPDKQYVKDALKGEHDTDHDCFSSSAEGLANILPNLIKQQEICTSIQHMSIAEYAS